MVVWPTIFSAGPPPTRYAKPLTPTKPIAMPIGTRSSISTNRTTNPMTATRSGLMRSLDRPDRRIAAEEFGMEDQPVSAHGDQQHGGDVTDPGEREERPHRQPQVEGEQVRIARGYHLVEQGVGLHHHDEQQHQGREHVDHPLPL